MSHLTKLQVKINNRPLAKQVAGRWGWTVREGHTFHNNYSGQKVENAMEFRDHGKTKMVVAQDGNVHIDTWSMGREHEQFMQDYAASHIQQRAEMDGAMVTNRGRDKNGNLVVEVEYA